VGGSVLCPIEVKNIRHWIYPTSHELFQLLYKAGPLQAAHTDLAICPVLITRKRSWTADQMSRDLGFRILDLHKQFVLPIADVREEDVSEVQVELGFHDLTRTDSADPTLTGLLGNSIRRTAQANADRWRDHGRQLVGHYDRLRNPSLRDRRRAAAMDGLREAAVNKGCWGGAW
jgi:hypothetical protein